MKGAKKKLNRRLDLLDELLDYALRSKCKFVYCDGPLAPIRDMKTCSRCRCINRGIRLGLVKKNPEGYVRSEPVSCYVEEGALEQFSAIDGEQVR